MRIVRLLSIRRPEDRQWRHRLYLPDVDIGSAEIGEQENHAAILYCLAKPLTAEDAEDAEENPNPSEEELKHFMHGNICRCTGYKRFIESIMAAAKKMRRT